MYVEDDDIKLILLSVWTYLIPTVSVDVTQKKSLNNTDLIPHQEEAYNIKITHY